VIKMREFTQDEAERILGEVERRLKRLEAYETGKLPLSAPRNPSAGMAWLDVEAGQIKLWTGAAWVSFTKDV
jgi:hypothetical protein